MSDGKRWVLTAEMDAQLRELAGDDSGAFDALVACCRALAHAGAKATEFRFDHGRFVASATLTGRRIIVDDCPDDIAGGADELTIRVIHAARCTSCGKVVVAQDHRPLPLSVLTASGQREERTGIDRERAGLCWWDRKGQRWMRECGDEAPAGSTRERLAQALIAERYVHAEMIAAARGARYDEWLATETAFPLMLLVDDLKQYGEQAHGLIERVKAGDFDCTKEEGDAWAASPEGQATFAEFGHMLPKPDSSAPAERSARPPQSHGKDAARAAAERARRKSRR